MPRLPSKRPALASGSGSEPRLRFQNLPSRRVVSFQGLISKVVPVLVGTVQAGAGSRRPTSKLGKSERRMISTYRLMVVLECWVGGLPPNGSTPPAECTYVILGAGDNGIGMDHQTRGARFRAPLHDMTHGKGSRLDLSILNGILCQTAGHTCMDTKSGERTTSYPLPFARTKRRSGVPSH